MAGLIGEAAVRVRADVAGFSKQVSENVDKSVRSAQGAADRGGQQLGTRVGVSMGKGLRASISESVKGGLGVAAAAAGGVLAITKGFSFLKDSVNAAKESQLVQQQVAATVNRTGQSYAKFRGQIDNVIAGQSKLSALDDEDLAQSFTALDRTTGSVTKALQLNAIAANIARARHISVGSAAQALTRIYLGNVGGLKRLGVEFTKTTPATDALKARIKTLGDELKKAPKSHQAAIKAAIDLAKSHLTAAKNADVQSNAQRAVAAVQQTFAGQARAYANTTAGQLEALGVQWENFKETVGAAVLPVVVASLRVLIGAITQLGQVVTPIVQAIAAQMRALAPTFQQVLPTVQAVAVAIPDGLGAAIQAVTGFIDAHRAAFELLAGVIGGAVAGYLAIQVATTAYSAALGVVALAQKVATVAQLALDAAMDANPIGIVVIALAALAGALVVLYQRNETVRQSIQAAWAVIRSVVGAAAAFISSTVIPDLTTGFNAVKSVVTTLAGAIETGFNAAKGPITTLATTVSGALVSAWNAVKPVISAVLEIVGTVLVTQFNVAKGVIQTIAALLHGDFSGAWEAAKGTVAAAVNGISTVVRQVIGDLGPALLGLAEKAGTAIANGIKTAGSKLTGLGGDLAQAVGAAISNAASAAAGLAVQIGTRIKDGAISGITGLAGAIRDKAESEIKSGLGHLNPFSPVEHGGQKFIGEPIIRGAISGILAQSPALKNVVEGTIRGATNALHLDPLPLVRNITSPLRNLLAPSLRSSITGAFRDAIGQAKGNLAQLGSSLSGFIGQILDARAVKANAALSPLQQQIDAIDAQLNQHQIDRQRAQLTDAATAARGNIAGLRGGTLDDLAAAGSIGAPTEEARQAAIAQQQQAIQDLNDFEAQQRRDALAKQLADEQAAISQRVDAQKTGVTQQVNDLIAAYSQGNLSVAAFNKDLAGILAANDVDFANAGQTLGFAFADSFQSTVQAITAQVRDLMGGLIPGLGTEPGVVSPVAALTQQIRDARAAASQLQGQVNQAKAQARDKSGPGGTKTTADEQANIDKLTRQLAAQNSTISGLTRALAGVAALAGPLANVGSVTVVNDPRAAERALNEAARGTR